MCTNIYIYIYIYIYIPAYVCVYICIYCGLCLNCYPIVYISIAINGPCTLQCIEKYKHMLNLSKATYSATIQAIHFFISTCVPWESNPRILRCQRNALTTEPKEHMYGNILIYSILFSSIFQYFSFAMDY